MCPTEIVTSLSDLGLDIPDGGIGIALVTLPVKLEEGCDCIVDNVAIDIGINHPNVNDLFMVLFSPAPDFDFVTLVERPPSDANLVAENLIKFDDTPDVNTKDPQTLGANVDANDDIPTATYYALGNNFPTIGGTYPNAAGLVKFIGETAEGDWIFEVTDNACEDTVPSNQLN
jgi:hypothetical protein